MDRNERSLDLDLEWCKSVGTTESILDNTLKCFQELERLIEVKGDDSFDFILDWIRECKSKLLNYCEQLEETESLISNTVQEINQIGCFRLPNYPLANLSTLFAYLLKPQYSNTSNSTIKKRKLSKE